MGACDISFTIGGKASISEVADALRARQERDSEYNGHQEGYSGDFQTVHEVKCEFQKLFTSYNEAYEYCLANAEKWEHVVAVHYIDVTVERTKLQIKLEEKIVKLKEEERVLYRTDDKPGFIKCSHCGSRLNKKHLDRKTCVLCGQSLLNRRELAKVENIAKKIKNNQGLIDKIKGEQKAKAIAKNGQKNIKTLVAGWGAC